MSAGLNFRLSDINSALGLIQIKTKNDYNKKKITNVSIFFLKI